MSGRLDFYFLSSSRYSCYRILGDIKTFRLLICSTVNARTEQRGCIQRLNRHNFYHRRIQNFFKDRLFKMTADTLLYVLNRIKSDLFPFNDMSINIEVSILFTYSQSLCLLSGIPLQILVLRELVMLRSRTLQSQRALT